MVQKLTTWSSLVKIFAWRRLAASLKLQKNQQMIKLVRI